MSETNPLLSCGRSNQFRIRDLTAFKQALSDFNVTIDVSEDDDHLVSLLAHPRKGISFSNEQRHILESVVPHLDGTAVAILMQIGYNQDSLELMGNAVAANAKGQMRQVDLSYIYKMAEELSEGTQVEECAE